MSNHEYFRELCALAAIGQLSSDEEHELGKHLFECANCRETNAEYSHVVQHQLPRADPIRWRIKESVPKTPSDADLRDRFLARARVEGVELSPEVERTQQHEPRFRFGVKWHWQRLLASAAVAVIAVMGFTILRLQERKAAVPSSVESEARLLEERNSLRSQLARIQQDIERSSAGLVAANKEKSASEQALQQLRRQLEEAQAKSDDLTAQLQQLEAKQAELVNTNHERDSFVADLKTKNEALRRDHVEDLTARVLLESQVRDLRNSTDRQAASFEQERQLMVASKDVRQLMGARNLHVMDVHDTDGAGKSAKAFGRVFYAEGQSLIFYAFDLPGGRLAPAKYTFQAWGENEAVSHSVRKLGTFAVDDHEQRRWVLKVNDAKLLQGIDSVFVTAEASNDVGEPRGKKLLYAYVVGEPNHP